MERVELEGVPAVAFADLLCGRPGADRPSEDDSAGWPEYANTVVQAVGDRSDLVLGLREDSYELVVDGDELQPMSLCRRPGLHR